MHLVAHRSFMRILVPAFFIILLIFGETPAVQAQTIFIPLAGINFSGTVGGEPLQNYDHDYGWKAGGIFVRATHAKNYSICAGITASSRSYKYQFSSGLAVNNTIVPAYYYEHLIFGYVEAPVYFMRSFRSGLHADAGLFIGYQLSQRRNEIVNYEVLAGSVMSELSSTIYSREITADRFQVGPQLGIGYVKSGFDLTITSQYHLTPLMNFATDTPDKLHFLNLSLSLGYRFKHFKQAASNPQS